MNANLRKATNLYGEFIKKNGHAPKFVKCYIRWNNDGEIHLYTLALGEYDIDTKDDEKIFFYAGCQDNIISMLANLDYTADTFESIDDYKKQIAADAEFSPEWFDYGGEEFTILDVVEYADSLDELGW